MENMKSIDTVESGDRLFTFELISTVFLEKSIIETQIILPLKAILHQ